MASIPSRTSITVDEAVGNLLGWGSGPIDEVALGEYPTPEEQKIHDELYFSIQFRLHDIREGLEADLSWAKHGGPQSEIKRLEKALAKHAATEDLAYSYLCAIEDELNKGENSALRKDLSLSNNVFTYITLASFDDWATDKYGVSILSPVTSSKLKPEPQAPQPASEQPWLVERPDDPLAEQPWYTPARHFARQLVANDSTLLSKRDQLAKKVVQSLTDVGIFKRGGKKPFDPGTVKKAFVNLVFK